jgi:hypothetical protein
VLAACRGSFVAWISAGAVERSRFLGWPVDTVTVQSYATDGLDLQRHGPFV